MGWLVQAEAPPGALFQKFKSMILAGQASPPDIAFYFAHWLTDLAGAEPCPQEGCEKFVLKFPLRVLGSFLQSFPFVRLLSAKSEAQAYEQYLSWRWESHAPSLGAVPYAKGSVASLRLVVMAQGNSQRVLDAIAALPQRDLDVLQDELAHTGCKGQSYSRDVPIDEVGPAFLVYYAPALLQKSVEEDAEGALAVFAEVLRQARKLWPLEEKLCGETVTLRIDALKELKPNDIKKVASGNFWVIQRTSNIDAVVKQISLDDSGQEQFDQSVQRILAFGRHDMNDVELIIESSMPMSTYNLQANSSDKVGRRKNSVIKDLGMSVEVCSC